MKTRLLFIILLLILVMPVWAQGAGFDKFSLWAEGTQLRGANIWQRVVIPELDGLEFMGSGPVGPPFTQADFDRLAAMGANYVNLSHPGLFALGPPYALDGGAQDNLDRLLDMAAKADLFAVISFRTGPGRSDFTFYADGAGVWYDANLLVETVWTQQAEQDAWVKMWSYTAERYRDNPVVAGYDLMVEPNAEASLFEIYDPAEFYPAHANTLADWNQFYPRIVAAIRKVDTQTPILISASGWGNLEWLPYLMPLDDPRIVYTVHQYEPHEYTHQVEPTYAYPGEFDADYDGTADMVNRDWLAQQLSVIRYFALERSVPVAVNEFGVHRFVPGAAQFMDDEMTLFEELGVNYALWAFNPSWPPFQNNDDFDFLHGQDRANHNYVGTSPLLEVIKAYWARNEVRPSNTG